MRLKTGLKLCIAATIFSSVMVASAQADFGTAGWGIFSEVQSSQFSGISTTAQSNGDIAGMLYNPAMLGMTHSREISFVSQQGIDSDMFGSVMYTEPLKNNSMLGASVAYYDAGSVELNWLNNGVLNTNTVSAEKDMMGVVTFEHQPCKNLSLGISLKAASSELAQQYTAYAYAVDAGLMYLPIDNLSISLAIQNLGTSTKFIDQANPLPTGVYGGVGYTFHAHSLYILPMVGFTYLTTDQESVPEAGVEIGCGCISVNAGYRNFPGESNTQIGMKIVWGSYTFGYAFLPGTNLDTVQRLSVGYRFNSPQGLR